MSSFCQQNSTKIHGNNGIYRIKIQNIVQKEIVKYIINKVKENLIYMERPVATATVSA